MMGGAGVDTEWWGTVGRETGPLEPQITIAVLTYAFYVFPFSNLIFVARIATSHAAEAATVASTIEVRI